MSIKQEIAEQNSDPRKEWGLFIFIVVFLFPLLSVAIVGGFGFMVWMYQLLAGPPGAVSHVIVAVPQKPVAPP